MSVSLISSHTVLDTPTSMRRRADRESVGLDKAFCEEGGHQVSCSQELFGSPEVFEEEREETDNDPVPAMISSIPDSPRPQTEHTNSPPPPKPDSSVDHSHHMLHSGSHGGSCDALPARDVSSELTESPNRQLGAVEQSGQPTCVQSEQHGAEAAESSVVSPCTDQQQHLSQPASVPTLKADTPAPAATHPPITCSEPSAKRRRVAAKTFFYPGSKQLGRRKPRARKVHQGMLEVQEVECSVMESPGLPLPSGVRNQRKRSTSDSVAPPGKRPHLHAVGGDTEVSEAQLQDDEGEDGTGGRPAGKLCVAAVTSAEVAIPNIKTEVLSSEAAADITAATQSVRVDLPQAVSSAAQKSAENADKSSAGSSSILSLSTSNQLPVPAEQRMQLVQSTLSRTVHAPIRLRGSGSRAPGLRRMSVRRESTPVEGGAYRRPSLQETEPAADQERVAHSLSSPPPAPPPCPPPATPPLPTTFPPSVGFQTASGRSIQVSAKGMERAQRLMADEAEGKEHGGSERKLPSRSTYTFMSPRLPAPGLTASLTPSTGFQTASGRSVSISEKGMLRARRLLHEEIAEKEESPKLPVSPAALCERGTASPVLPQTGQDTLPTTPLPSRPLPHPLLQGAPTEGKVGGATFRTPSTGPSHPPAWSTGPTSPPAWSTGGLRARGLRRGKPFKAPRLASSVSREEEQAKTAHLLQSLRRAGAGTDPVEPGGEGHSTEPQTPAVHIESGFSTAGGRRLSMSASSFRHAQKLMAEEKEDRGATMETPTAPPLDGPVPFLPPLSCGFQSASGKGLQVSAKAMERAQSLFSDISDGDTSTTTLPGDHHPITGSAPEHAGTAHLSVLTQHSQSSFTVEDLDREDIDNLTAFTQVQFPPRGQEEGVTGVGIRDGRCGDDRTDASRPSSHPLPVLGIDGASGNGVPGAEEGEEKGEKKEAEEDVKEEEEEEEEDHSAYFSTQVVKQFLDFSNEEEDDNKSVFGSKITSAQEGEGLPHAHSQPQGNALITADINSSEAAVSGQLAPPTLPPDCSARQILSPEASGL